MIQFSINDITKYYASNKIFENISFDAKEGERIGLIGQNGCGKTTILKILMGIEEYQKGVVSIRKGAKLGYLDQMPDYGEKTKTIDVLTSAFTQLHQLKERIALLEKKLSNTDDKELEKSMIQYGNLLEEYERGGGYEIETNINKICEGLKISDNMKQLEFSRLSGGEKTRTILGKILLENPDILLLDEPSNHLDMDSIQWLENFLKDYKGTIVVISHDRYFLDRVATKVVEIEFNKANIYNGNYSYYNVEKERRFLIALNFYKNQQREIKRVQAQIQRYRIWGEMRDSDKMYRKAKELEKRLEKMEKVEKPILEKRKIHLLLDQGKRAGKRVLEIKNLSHAYEDKQLLTKVSLEVFYQDSLCIIGKNGTGKTTLLKKIIDIASLEYYDGEDVKWGTGTSIGYLPQEVKFEDETMTVIEYFQREHLLNQGQARNALAKVLFVNDDVFKKISSLSGGEKSKLMLCSLLYAQVNTLILDEPTNHLDIDSREVLENILQEYPGTIIFVSHDRYFITKIATKIAQIENTQIKTYNGDYDYYLQQYK